MTALEELLRQLKDARRAALIADDSAKIRFANLVLGAWPTIQHALEEMNRRRIA